MKTKIIYPIVFLLISSLSFSQGFKDKKEKVKALKVAYITEQLDLTTEEAQKFWPIYNAFDDKQSELRHEKMRAILDRFEPENVEKLSEKEASTLLTQMESVEESLFALRKKFIKDLQGVISAKKIIKLKKAEEDFNRTLLRQIKERRKG
ncbi:MULTISPECIES: sensor of ECF-type sigma factor [unclassified Flavobacterium]|uniref:sensor of ECF-type sigma factor n=1 Tax=unclassified Flavobacterium TaxID=196869 RepID=UPI0012914E79|nr:MULTISPECIES: sensor of ECF-type sigma factor [unclassified Flavobacterium]MQP52327.1 sensor of ECF-type sigma factor [Flavobacterium sp. LMO9]MQP62397.1 sensor of ECF-type sigma factor [Flavobacterium sp. LMO6]